MKEVNYWDLQTRIFHWSLVVSVICTLVTADMPRAFGFKTINADVWLAFHIATGTAAAVLLLFRLFWGFEGPYYSRFSSFHLSISELISYLNSVLKNQKPLYTDHNPGASWTAAGFIISGLSAVATGMLVYALDENRGMLHFLYRDFYQYAGTLKLLHHLTAYIIAGLIFIHIAGALLENFRFKTGIIMAMFTGKKQMEDEDIRVTTPIIPAIVSYVWVLLPLPVFLFIYNDIYSRQPELINPPAVYKHECGACHMAFPPNILPAASWKKMLSDLDDHFGDYAACDEKSRKEIEDFLVKNSAEKIMDEAGVKFLDTVDKNDPLRVTATAYWEKKHDDIKPEIYKRASITSKLNCAACHKWAEYGSFEDNDISIPR